MLGARSIPAPKGRLASRSLGALLASARARRASVVLELDDGPRRGEITFVQGRVLRATTTDDVAKLGMLLFERGLVHDRALGECLEESQRSGKLLGAVLLERELVTAVQLESALAEQTRRRVLQLFGSSDACTYEVHELASSAIPARDQGRPTVDPWPLVHRGLLLHPRPELVTAAVGRLDGMIRLRDLRVLDELQLEGVDRAFCEDLATRPALVVELLADTRLPRARAEHLVYVLALGRHLERTASEIAGPEQLGEDGVRARVLLAEAQGPHALLGVPEGASAEAIRAAYFRLARLWHPDRLPGPLSGLRPECDHVFSRMTDAFRVLMEHPVDARAAPAPAPVARKGLVSLPPPTTTLVDVDRALSRADFETASRLASTLVRTGAHGPPARAVVAMCRAAGPRATFSDVEQAILELDKIIGGDPECVRALFYRGVLLKRLRRIDAAVRDFRRIVRLEPNHVDAQRELRLADMRSKRESGEHAASLSIVGVRAAPPEGRDRGPLASPPAGASASPSLPESGLRALLAKVVGRS